MSKSVMHNVHHITEILSDQHFVDANEYDEEKYEYP